jgi:hypothetical protein
MEILGGRDTTKLNDITFSARNVAAAFTLGTNGQLILRESGDGAVLAPGASPLAI